MKTNRDILVILMNVLKESDHFHTNDPVLLDGMAATGVRGLRVAKEVRGFKLHLNDVDPKTIPILNRNIELNSPINAQVTREDVRKILLNERFDVVDIDPFGSPAPFIDFALYGLKMNGILAVTATDTGALYGTYPKPCIRRYDSKPLKTYFSHELGIRILASSVIRKAAVRDLAAYPVLCYAQDHYYRLYFRLERGAKKADSLLDRLGYVIQRNNTSFWNITPRFELMGLKEKDQELGGPIYLEPLVDEKLGISIKKFINKQQKTENYSKTDGFKEASKILTILLSEYDKLPFFYCSHDISMNMKVSPPQLERILETFQQKGICMGRTHLSPTGFKIHRKHEKDKDNIDKMIRDVFIELSTNL